jgi:hypothetical protein
MRRKKWFPVLLIAALLVVFFQYRMYDAGRTDTVAPEITIDSTQLLRVSVSDPMEKLLRDVRASDDRDGDMTHKLVVESMQLIDESGLIEVSYAVADNAGNVEKVTREVLYTDYRSPRFSLSEALIFYETESYDILSIVGAADVLDGDIQHRIRATALSEIPVFEPGIHQVYFQVTNSIGDTAEMTIPVEVRKTGDYPAEVELKSYLVYLSKGSRFDEQKYLDSFILRGTTYSLEGNLSQNFHVEVTGQVNTDIPGTYAVEYKVTYTVPHEINPDFDQKFTGCSRLIVVVEG